LDETALIPYQASDLAAGRVLVLAAHPDDEVLGAGGTIARNAATAEAVCVWIATDGDRQEGVAPGEEAAYGHRRREEARRAASVLGIPEPRFGAFPDRGLAEASRELDRALSALLDDFRPDLVLCPSPVEIHPDHRALAEALFSRVAASRPGDLDHDRYRLLRVGFYEISHPLLPNMLVDVAGVADRKAQALAAYESQQAVRDYSGAVAGLNAYRRLTLSGSGPVEAFRVLSYPELSTVSLEAFRRSIGPTFVTDGARGAVPVSVVVRTRNRPALLEEALESLRAQIARPRQVVVVNDGGAALPDLARFRDAWDLVVEELPERGGRSAAANRGVARATEELVAFLDDDDVCAPDHFDRLYRAYRDGPQPVVYSDAVTAVYTAGDEGRVVRHRGLQYSLDFDPDYLLLANYIPLHTLLLPRAMYRSAGGFDEGIEYSEDWDFLIRLSFQTPFRHVRAVTCEYRVFEDGGHGDLAHVGAGAAGFQQARESIYSRYASRRTDAGTARAFDRMRAQVAFWYERDVRSQGELVYQRESHRLLALGAEQAEKARQEMREVKLHTTELETERAHLLVENELVHARLADVYAANERYDAELGRAHSEIERLGSILDQIFASRSWKLHLFFERLRGRR
jgi:LmbE family N-acetylglucosaminyl deacetylase/glycosyltransferase involved in cell wall biosynthesis